MFATFDGPTHTHPMRTFRMRNNRTLVVKNEMRTVENAKRNETYGTDTRDIRDDSDIKNNKYRHRCAVRGLAIRD